MRFKNINKALLVSVVGVCLMFFDRINLDFYKLGFLLTMVGIIFTIIELKKGATE